MKIVYYFSDFSDTWEFREAGRVGITLRSYTLRELIPAIAYARLEERKINDVEKKWIFDKIQEWDSANCKKIVAHKAKIEANPIEIKAKLPHEELGDFYLRVFKSREAGEGGELAPQHKEGYHLWLKARNRYLELFV